MLLAFPAVLLLLGILLVTLGLNGSSSGIFHDQLSYGTDENLVAGHPLIARSDEWNVQTVWAIAQVQQGLPVTNETFPGGMDTTLPQDLPRADWTVAFRPHLLAFLVFDVDQAFAFKWWHPWSSPESLPRWSRWCGSVRNERSLMLFWERPIPARAHHRQGRGTY